MSADSVVRTHGNRVGNGGTAFAHTVFAVARDGIGSTDGFVELAILGLANPSVEGVVRVARNLNAKYQVRAGSAHGSHLHDEIVVLLFIIGVNDGGDVAAGFPEGIVLEIAHLGGGVVNEGAYGEVLLAVRGLSPKVKDDVALTDILHVYINGLFVFFEGASGMQVFVAIIAHCGYEDATCFAILYHRPIVCGCAVVGTVLAAETHIDDVGLAFRSGQFADVLGFLQNTSHVESRGNHHDVGLGGHAVKLVAAYLRTTGNVRHVGGVATIVSIARIGDDGGRPRVGCVVLPHGQRARCAVLVEEGAVLELESLINDDDSLAREGCFEARAIVDFVHLASLARCFHEGLEGHGGTDVLHLAHLREGGNVVGRNSGRHRCFINKRGLVARLADGLAHGLGIVAVNDNCLFGHGGRLTVQSLRGLDGLTDDCAHEGVALRILVNHNLRLHASKEQAAKDGCGEYSSFHIP